MMTKIYSKALKRSLDIQRIIGHIKGTEPGPTLIFLAGVHGNEPSGVFALQEVLDRIKEDKIPIKGNTFAIGGNLDALKKGVRYNHVDLNRQWTSKTIQTIKEDSQETLNQDLVELKEIYSTLKYILDNYEAPYYFFDLHTTSSQTVPFLTVNDSLLNRRYTTQYPTPIILGIEEYLDGPLLSWVNELGYVAFGFEGGQHDDIKSIENHVAFTYLSLVFTGAADPSDVNYLKYHHILSRNAEYSKTIYEIHHRQEVLCREDFKMVPGFDNFQPIKKGEHLAFCRETPLYASRNGLIFMPLYQGKGEDGFFIIRPVPGVFLKLSAWLRRIGFDQVLPLLPGVKWTSTTKGELEVDLKVARFLARPFLHLLGYRSKEKDATHLRVKNREAASKNEDYLEAEWLKR